MRTQPPGRRGGGVDGDHLPSSERGPHHRREHRADQSARVNVPFPTRGEVLYGRQAVAEALGGRRKVWRVLIAEGVRDVARLSAIVHHAEERSIAVTRVPRMQLDALTNGANHQGIALEVEPFAYSSLEAVMERQSTILVLDHFQDPQNFGTLLRTAEVAGVAGIVVPRDRAVGVTPAVVNASAGAVEHLRVAQETNLARTLGRLVERGWWAIGLDTGADAVDLFVTHLPAPVALVVGSEGSGLTPIVRKRCQLIISLPIRGRITSLNAATAGSIALFELLRRELMEEGPPSGESG